MAKILIIDDDRMVRDTLRMLLKMAGHQLIFAVNGQEGTQAFAEHKPDLVITDILMPEKEGLATIRDLRQLSPTVPIIAMSGGGRMGNTSFLAVAEQFGADKTLSKPFEPSEVLGAIADLLKRAA